MDETYIKVRGKWSYLYRAADRDGQTLEFMLSENRDMATARRFFKRAIGTNGVPERIVIDKSGANLAGLQSLSVILKSTRAGRIISIQTVCCARWIIVSTEYCTSNVGKICDRTT